MFIAVSHRGEVEIFEGYLSRADARRRTKNSTAEEDASEPVRPSRPAMTKSMQNYLELHRHAVVRAALLAQPATALRLMVAHAAASSGHWQVKAEPQQARGKDIAASVAASPAQQAFATEKTAVLALLAVPEDHESVSRGNGDAYRTALVFARLLTLSDDEVLRIAATVMAETLAAGSPVVEALGLHLKINPRGQWQPDETFFGLIREKATVNVMLAEVAGKQAADGNLAERAKTQKQIIRDCLDGANGRDRTGTWLPGWMEFPFRGYGSGACEIADATTSIAALFPTA